MTPWLDEALDNLAPQAERLTLLDTDGWPKLTVRDWDDGHDHDGKLPPELEEYIESQRIHASEIPITFHGDGKATVHTRKQYSTVMMMVIDEDGTRRMVERQITPEGTLVVPYEENN